MKVFKIGSWSFILLGILHLLAHIFGKPNDPIATKLLQDMANYKINMMGQHNFLEFYNGFSIMMGFLLSAFGIQSLVLSEFIIQNKKALLTTISLTAIAFVLALIYFHLLAYGFIFVAFVCFLYAFFKGQAT